MKTVCLLLVVFILGCSTPPGLSVPGKAELHAILAGQACVATQAGFEGVAPWLDRESEVRYELGQWLPGEDATLLVTVDVINLSMAEGTVHHLVAVIDPYSHALLTPVFHLIAHHAERRVLPAKDQDVLVYAAHSIRNFTDQSHVVRFSPGKIDVVPAIGGRDPETHYLEFASSGQGTAVINTFEYRRGDRNTDSYRAVVESSFCEWNPLTLSFDPRPSP